MLNIIKKNTLPIISCLEETEENDPEKEVSEEETDLDWSVATDSQEALSSRISKETRRTKDVGQAPTQQPKRKNQVEFFFLPKQPSSCTLYIHYIWYSFSYTHYKFIIGIVQCTSE